MGGVFEILGLIGMECCPLSQLLGEKPLKPLPISLMGKLRLGAAVQVVPRDRDPSAHPCLRGMPSTRGDKQGRRSCGVKQPREASPGESWTQSQEGTG